MPLTNRIYSKHTFCHTAHHYSHGRPRINCMSDNVVVYGNKVRVVCHRRLRELLLLSLQIDRPFAPICPPIYLFPYLKITHPRTSRQRCSWGIDRSLFGRYRISEASLIRLVLMDGYGSQALTCRSEIEADYIICWSEVLKITRI